MSFALSQAAISLDLPRYELSGPRRAPVIVALGGISANHHVCVTDANAAPGWWKGVAGAARAIDTTRYRVLGVDFLDGGCGADGRPLRIVTTHDQADAIARVLDDVGVECVHAFIGASYGGMVALAFAERYAERLERLIVIGAAHRAHPMSTALRSIQRGIVELGVDTGRARDALSLARGLAMTTYRSAREFAQRFESAPGALHEARATFPVETYLRHHGDKFAAQWSASRFLALSLSTDLHSVNPARIRTPAVLVAAEGDRVVPREDIDALARDSGAPTTTCELASHNGHDAFLTEPARLGAILEAAIRLPTLKPSHV